MVTKAQRTYSKMSGKANPKPSDHQQEKSLDLSYMGSREERADTRTIASRKRLHDQMNDDVAAFLARGGEISHIDSHVTADPPKRPVSHYGSRPI